MMTPRKAQPMKTIKVTKAKDRSANQMRENVTQGLNSNVIKDTSMINPLARREEKGFAHIGPVISQLPSLTR